jgi:Rad3-related DNA helicase
MHEGVELKDDLSSFQVICKVTYPICFDDVQLKRRTEIDRNFYNWLVALKTCQSYGRSIRSTTDWADTYIIDESIFSFLDIADKMLPEWFKEAIIC